MQTKHLCVFIHMRSKGKVGIVKHFKALQPFCLPYQDGTSFQLLWILFDSYFSYCLCDVVLSVLCSLLVTCWKRGDRLALMIVVFCHCLGPL